ncbi:ElaB/YqjD/DUF883 family membrane-anchored ribosome-binding protein [Okibacterium sp. HSC-33S16]|uniref:hypothetical protein n=1 Tax=Okibacterium sp. HSC-33S16 TaxID=2910965 RepID=UPI0020A142B3|nr:hypothetical protein [Okibacterium sp. HSC-33S16]MCP2032994.1 ElaB/YqjD/DUF883 family membrane-anchored ribosome-binding protein [Okibacterium sp. HSC-33S16]
MTQTSAGADETTTTDRVRGAGSHVASTAAEGASNVKQEVGAQAKNLFGEVRSQLSGQVTTQQERAAGGIRTVSDQLRSMADSSDSGMASNLVSQAANRVGDVAGWLENSDPAGMLDDVKRFARRRPGVFIALAAGAGIVVGRLAKSLTSGDDSTTSSTTSGPTFNSTAPSSAASTPSAAPTQTYDATAADLGYVAAPGYADTTTADGIYSEGTGTVEPGTTATGGYTETGDLR